MSIIQGFFSFGDVSEDRFYIFVTWKFYCKFLIAFITWTSSKAWNQMSVLILLLPLPLLSQLPVNCLRKKYLIEILWISILSESVSIFLSFVVGILQIAIYIFTVLFFRRYNKVINQIFGWVIKTTYFDCEMLHFTKN